MNHPIANTHRQWDTRFGDRMVFFDEAEERWYFQNNSSEVNCQHYWFKMNDRKNWINWKGEKLNQHICKIND